MMSPKITNEQRAAILASSGGPVEVEDEQSNRVYILIPKERLQEFVDDRLRQELQIGFDQADAGDVADWDIDEMLAEAHRRHAAQES